MEVEKDKMKETSESVILKSERVNNTIEEGYKKGFAHNALFLMAQFVSFD